MVVAGLMAASFSAAAGDPTVLQFPDPAPAAPQAESASRVVRLTGPIKAEMAIDIINQLEELDKAGSGDITMIIHSGGGSVSDGVAIIDKMRSLNSRVNTVCEGRAMSMGAFILVAGTGTRSAYENCSIMIHEVSSSVEGTSTNVSNDAADVARSNQLLAEITSESTGLSMGQVRKAMRVDFSLSGSDAWRAGMIDKVIPVKHKRMELQRNRVLPPDLIKRLPQY